ncbi:MAG: hypothetical protein VKP63_07155 [Cyanobacteriota bacterium]|nr:hypothetical protein [Cyanobacteriota bacterium]
MTRAILLGVLAAAGVTVFASPSQAATDLPCPPTVAAAVEAPCLKTPPCKPAEAPVEAPCQS